MNNSRSRKRRSRRRIAFLPAVISKEIQVAPRVNDKGHCDLWTWKKGVTMATIIDGFHQKMQAELFI